MKPSNTNNAKKIIGRLIKEQRVKQKLTQKELADILNVGRQYVWKIENGRINLTLEYLDKIILKLKCTYNDFFKNT